MKKLILMLLVSATSFSQSTYASLQVDGRNATFGSSPTNNKPELDMVYSNKNTRSNIVKSKAACNGSL